VLFLRAAIEAAVEKRPRRAPLNDLRYGVGVRLVGKHPWPALEIEDAGVAAQALGDVDADVEVEADLDVAAPIDLAQGGGLPRRRGHRLTAALPPHDRSRFGSTRLVWLVDT
jgi:hypothetical protein